MSNNNPVSGDFLGHPRGLYVLFLTEMWERFSYYGMRVLLVFYLTQHFMFDDKKAILIVGSYNALVNASPLIGGLIADRYLGFNKAIILGAMLMLLGHAGMAYEGTAAYTIIGDDGNDIIVRDTIAITVLYLSLALLVIGVGFLKPNISSLVGNLYAHDDPRRDSGFTIFQMGINLGATISALLCGYLGQTLGWAYGFGSAAIAMGIGLIIFLNGRSTLQGHGTPPDEEKLRRPVIAFLNMEHLNYIGTFILIIITWQLFRFPELIGGILLATAIVCGLWLLWFAIYNCEKIQRDRVFAFIILLAFFLIYVVLLEQVSTSLNLFIDRNVDRVIGAFTFQASQIYAVLPGMFIVFAPILAWVWISLAKRGRNPSVPFKFALGFSIMGIAYFLLIYGAQFANTDSEVALYWVIGFFILLAISDLFVVPIAISSVTYLAPRNVLGFMMGIYFFSISAANYLAAMAANTAAIPDVNTGELDKGFALSLYENLFTNLSIAAIVIAVLIFVMIPFIRKLMH